MAANGWQQKQHRIPAFGDWNYHNPRDDDDGAGGWPPVTPCFEFASAMRTAARPAAQHKSDDDKRSSMSNARRMRIPAFGEWNHRHGDDVGTGNGNGTWPAVMTPFFDLTATPQPQKAPNAGRRRRRGGDGGFDAAKLATAAEAQAPQGHMMQTRRSKVADSGAYAAAAARRSCFTVAKPVDDDLYGVPPDMMLYGKSPGATTRKDGWLWILRRLLGCSSCLSPSS